MGREIRRVAKDWRHPKRDDGRYVPLFEPAKPIREIQADWDRECAAWDAGTHQSRAADDDFEYAEWAGNRPLARQFMPWWPDEQRTHYQMYETTSEGTPVSPVLDSPEAVAQWCYEHHVGVFGSMTASLDEWMAIAGGRPTVGIMVNSATGEIKPA